MIGRWFYYLLLIAREIGVKRVVLCLIYRLNVLEHSSDEWYWKLKTLMFADEPYKLPGRGGGINSVIRWLQMNWRSDLPTRCADKIAVREFVRDRIGEKYLIPQLPAEGVSWTDPGAIDFDALPSAFVLKLNNGSGMNLIVRDKSALDKNEVRQKLGSWLKSEFSERIREYQYAGIKNQIYCEELLPWQNGKPPMDYKFMCTNGNPLFVWVDTDRFDDHQRGIYSTDWDRLDVSIMYKKAKCDVPRPPNLEEMLQVAGKLSEGIPLVRVDLYNIDGKIYFGEMTFTSDAGIGKVEPFAFSVEMAAKVDLGCFQVIQKDE